MTGTGPPTAPAFGSDLVVDLLGALGIEYAAFNPGASFRGLHDSLVNHGGPQPILCTHEEISVALAHGYAKATGRPMVVMLHDVVGLQHACMAIFNAWCDRVPILLLGGTGAMDAARRRPWIEWIHTALVQGNHVRDFVKWDDQPQSVAAAVESLVRAYRLIRAEPCAPAYVCLDVSLQEDPLPPGTGVPSDLERWIGQTTVQPETGALESAADWLAAAERPVILADRVGRSAEGPPALVRLAELLGAPVVDLGARFNFPSTHPLDATGAGDVALADADLVLAVDVTDLHGALRKAGRPRRVLTLSVADLLVRSWSADYQQLEPADLALVGDSRVTLPVLAELVAARLDPGSAAARVGRARALGEASGRRRAAWEAEARADERREGVTAAYLALALREALAGHEWVLANVPLENWVRRLWKVERREHWSGSSGGAGIGYGIGASLGVALAYRGSGRIVVDLQSDGDLLYCTSALWTAARERLPLLVVMHNNRSYRNSEVHAAAIARRRGRPVANRTIGTRIEDPAVDFASVARGLGIAASGPVAHPRDLAAALADAVATVAAGAPCLVDVVVEEPDA